MVLFYNIPLPHYKLKIYERINYMQIMTQFSFDQMFTAYGLMGDRNSLNITLYLSTIFQELYKH